MRFFFYGTLIDDDVRARVLDGLRDAERIEPARLHGWRRLQVRGRPYPAVVPQRGGSTEGVLVHGLPDAAFGRLVAYEGSEYDVAECEVETGRGMEMATVFVAGAACRTGLLDWDLDAWRRRHKERFLASLRRAPPG